MAMGEPSLFEFVQVLFQQLASPATMAFARTEKIKSHFRKLRDYFRIILGVLDDAEEIQLIERSVKVWLEGLADLAYDLDDVLDEITTQALIQDSKGIQHNRTSMTWKFFPTFSSYTPGTLVSNYRLMSRIEDITKRIQFIMKQKIDLNLRENLGGSSNRSSVLRLPRSPTIALVNEPQLYRRDEDKKAITKMLLGDEACHDDISIILIVGMGGIGKTTLAQLAYTDKRGEQNYHVRAWVCVSKEFDLLAIPKIIFEKVTETSGLSKDLDTLQVSLQEKLSKTKFLIVLDDVWTENCEKWDQLCRPFQCGLPGSRIIVTTRNDSVASVVGSPHTAYHMKLLTDDDCLSLLSQHTGTSFHDNSELREIGLGLVKKCKGLPLAAKALGGLLRTKASKEEWADGRRFF